MSHKVYVLGSINYDLMITADRLPNQGETINGYEYLEMVGGKGSNQASASAKLGAETYLIGSVGNDMHGKLAKDNLKGFGVNIDYVLESKEYKTGVAIIVSIEKDNRIIINSGANSIVDFEYVKEVLQDSQKGDIFLSQFETPIEVVYLSLKEAKKRELVTVLNPAPAYKIEESIFEFIDYLVVNQSEAEILTGVYPQNEKQYREVSEVLFKYGLKNLIITLGQKGCVYISKNEYVFEKSHSVKVKDTTGAGDTFIGSLVYGLSRKWSINKCLRMSNIAGALACTEVGAKSGMPTLEEVQEFLSNRDV